MECSSEKGFRIGAALFAAGMLQVLIHSPAAAQIVTLAEDATNTVVVTDLTGFATTGQDMGGKLSVTAFFVGGASQTVPWLPTGVGSGAATGTGWSLIESGDTWTGGPGVPGRWQLDVTSDNVLIDRLRLVGVSGTGVKTDGVVFDRTSSPDIFATPGSAQGRDYVIDAALSGNWDLNVTYVDLVDSAADGPGALKDIWGQLDLDFVPAAAGGGGFFGFNDRLLFRQDTDTVGPRIPGECNRDECLPEPGSAMAALMLGGMCLARRRR